MTPAAQLPFRVLGEPIRLAEPGALRLLAVVAALSALAALSLWRRRRALARAAGRLSPKVAPTAGAVRPALRAGLGLLGPALLCLALARPQCGTRSEVTRRLGVDLVVALDVSRSMTARDLLPDRLTRARLEVEGLLGRLGGDRVGLVLFAGRAFPACPLTTDLEAVRVLLRGAGPDSVPEQGTAVAAALEVARAVLLGAEGGARSRLVLLVSDGEDQEPGAREAAAALSAAGIRIWALGVGTRGGAPIPLLDASGAVAGYKRDRRGEPVVTRLDPAALAALAAAGGGEVLEVGRRDRGMDAFGAALDRLARSEEAGRATVVWEDRFAWLAFPALLALLGALLLPEARPATSLRARPEGPP